MKRKFLKVICFLGIGILLFWMLQKIFIPKRIPYIDVFAIGKLSGLYNEENDSIDVIIEGSSHSAEGILPMELYEKYGIKSYNLSTSEQPIEATYYMLREALKTQKPEIFIWDVSNLYVLEHTNASWHRVLDDMRTGENKLAFAKEYCKKYQNEGSSIYEVMFPLLEYHTRWRELTRRDFTYFHCNTHDYRKGGEIVPIIVNSGITVEAMNNMTRELLEDTEKVKYTYTGGVYKTETEENILYSGEIPDGNLAWLFRIKDLCDENDVQLLMIKVPCINYPQVSPSVWTEEKYKKMQMLCDEYGISYYDLLYDTNLGIDCEKDSMDGGYHLNLYGAQKATVNLGGYLKEHYELSDVGNEKWDEELESYQRVRKVALLQLEQDFDAYLNMLMKEHKDKTIFIAASDDMTGGLNETDISILRQLGLQTDFSDAFQNSYIAVVENGEVLYESLSNRRQEYAGTCKKSGKTYNICSSGWKTSPMASVKLAGVEFAVNRRGLNIVVYDDDKGLVLDSVCFDTYAEKHTAIRNNEMINSFRQEFERYIVEIEDR